MTLDVLADVIFWAYNIAVVLLACLAVWKATGYD